MALYKPRYLVEYDPGQPPLEVAISSGDMLRAELEAKRLGVSDGLPFHTTVLWLWSALVRAGHETRKAGDFVAAPPEFQPLRDAAGEPELVQVDPTMPGPGETGSGAQPSTVTQGSG